MPRQHRKTQLLISHFFMADAVKLRVNMKHETSKLDPEIVVMGWRTTHHHDTTFLSCKLLIKVR